MKDFNGKTAIITGGASGIGLAAATHYLSAGMNVLIADLDEDALRTAAASLADSGSGTLHTQVCDVSDFAQVETLQATAAAKLGNVHCLMNNAGAGFPPSAPWENLDAWKNQVEINLWGIIHGCQAFVPAMLEGADKTSVTRSQALATDKVIAFGGV